MSDEAWGSASAADVEALKRAAVGRLYRLSQDRKITNGHVAMVAAMFGVDKRTVWRWLERFTNTGQFGRTQRARFRIDDAMRLRLAYHRGNATAVHKELVADAKKNGGRAPSVDTVQRAVRTDLLPGDREGLRHGVRAMRKFDVFLRRPATFRNDVWEGDHVQADVEVDVDGALMKPWITWFVDNGTNGICGAAITPTYPTRESVLVALGASISQAQGFGPFGGLPGRIRIDQGKDFLSGAVADMMAVFAVEVEVLPGYSPYLKGHIEALNNAVRTGLLAEMPRYTKAQTLVNNQPADPTAPAVTFEHFAAKVLHWIEERNSTQEMEALGWRTPLQTWESDPTPIEHVAEDVLALFTLEDKGKPRVVSTKGVQFNGLTYVGECLVGRVDDKVRVRSRPNHPGHIELFDANTGHHLGRAHLNDQASPEEIKALMSARARKARQLVKELKAVERTRRARYAAATTAAPPQALGTVSALEAAVELAEARTADMASQALPDLFPKRPPASGWAPPLADPSTPDDAPTTVGVGRDDAQGLVPATPRAADSAVRQARRDPFPKMPPAPGWALPLPAPGASDATNSPATPGGKQAR